MRILSFRFLSLGFLFSYLLLLGHASAMTWKMNSDSDGIQTYRRVGYAGKIIPLRATYSLNEPAAEIAAVLSDTPAKIEWIPRLHEAEILDLISPYERIELLTMNMPWPVADRDVVVKIDIFLSEDGKSADLNVKSIPRSEDTWKPAEGVIRAFVHSANMSIRIQDDGLVKVEAEAHSDPMGNLPGWVVNMVQTYILRTTIDNMIERVEERHYSEKEVDYYRRLLAGKLDVPIRKIRDVVSH